MHTTSFGRAARLMVYGILISVPQCVLAWDTDPSVNTPVCTATNSQTIPQLIGDGANGSIIVWMDGRTGVGEVYAQRINGSGEEQWATNGVLICTTGQDPQIVTDGTGGAIITWQDYRSGFAIYAQRVDSSGTIQWAANGAAISTSPSTIRAYPQITSDGSGGAVIVWQDQRNTGFTYDVYAQRIDGLGTVQWTAHGIPICTVANNQDLLQIINDGADGAIITWRDLRPGSNSDIYAQRVDASGAALWTSDGTAICTASNMQVSPQLVSDGSNGAIISWHDQRSGTDFDIYAQRIDALGSVLWSTNGVPVCTEVNNQNFGDILADGAGGAILAWQDDRNGASVTDIYAQRLNASGTEQWTTSGTAVCTATSQQTFPQIVSDDDGGSIITFQDFRNGTNDIYAQRLDSNGGPIWSANGVPVTTAGNSQTSGRVVSTGAGGAIVTWQDLRSGSNYDIYTSFVNEKGSVPVTISEFRAE